MKGNTDKFTGMMRRVEEPLSLRNDAGNNAGNPHYAQRATIIGSLNQQPLGLPSHGVYRLPAGTGLLQHTGSNSRVLDSGSHILGKGQDSAIPLTTSYHQPSSGHQQQNSYPGQVVSIHAQGGQSSPAQGHLINSNSQASSLSGGPIPPAHAAMTLSVNQVSNQHIVQSPNEPVNLQTTHQSHGYHHPVIAHQQIRHSHGGVGKIHGSTPIATPSPTGSSPAPSTPQPVSLTASAASTAQQQQFQRLKVEDALSYLDQVKYKFGGQPQVYNDFLDIMKEFKSQSIDTPGVIARVSSLFRGHPELIVGFNTFLPPGYKIEVKSSNHMAVSAAGGTISSLHTTTVVHAPSGIHHISASGAITYPVPQERPQQQERQPVERVAIERERAPIERERAPIERERVPVERERVPIERPPIERYVPTLNERSAATPPSMNMGRPPVAPTPPMTIKPPMASPGMAMPSNIAHYHSPTPPSSVGPPMPPVAHTPPPSQLSLSQQTTLQGTLSALAQNSGQPVEFNHAISYVNKIKSRFHGQPDIYKQFLEILHTYQKEQKMIKDGVQPPPGSRFLSEQEVYSQVARLFHHQEDLLAEFGQFLPDATSSAAIAISHRNMLSDHAAAQQKKTPVTVVQPPMQSPVVTKPVPVPQSVPIKEPVTPAGTPSAIKTAPKRPLEASPPQGGVPKKPRIMPAVTGVVRDVTVAEAAKYGSLADFAFFDKVRRALKSNDVYENFLRCLILFNQELVSRAELMLLVTPFLGKFPELLKWFRDFLGLNDSSEAYVSDDSSGEKTVMSLGPVDLLPNAVAKQEKISGELALEIDYSTCKRLGASYCALPRTHVQPKCSGRTALCKEVLNDTWVSFPSWSEDSTFVSSRKTQYEEYIYRCEDERFEMDVVLEANLATIRVLESVQKKMARMTPEEMARFKLDDCLGGTSSTIHIRAIRRIYGEKSNDIVEGLKRNPSVAVPVVLRRLKSKEEEWREAQKGFNKIWRDQNDKYYLKSLDHQGITFKQNDMKLLRTKSLLNEIETLFEERHEQADAGNIGVPGSVPATGPHLVLPYPDPSVLDDAAELLIYHAKRASIQKEEKKKIKILVKHTLPDLFMHQRQELSDDEKDDDDDEEEAIGRNSPSVSKAGRKNNSLKQPPDPPVKTGRNAKNVNGDINGDIKEEIKPNGEVKIESALSRGCSPITHLIGADYTLLMGNSAWYSFMRLHQILCERIAKMKNVSIKIASDYKDGKELPPSVVLKMRPQLGLNPPEYYTGLLDMVKSLLDNNMDSSTFEDTAREMFGIHAFPSFTLDKVVVNAVRQLQHIVSEETSIQCTELFFNSLKQRHLLPRAVAEASYQKRCEALVTDDNVLKMYIHRDSSKITIELLDTDSTEVPDKSEARKSRERWLTYVESYSQDAAVGLGEFSAAPDSPRIGSKPIFLKRNTRHWRKLKDKIKTEDLGEQRYDKKPDIIEERPELRGLAVNDNTKCKFGPNSYKLAFVVKSGSYVYRNRSLYRARRSHRRVTLDRHDKFSAWHTAWCENHVPSAEPALNWFGGRFEGSVPNNTRVIVVDEPGQPPYVPYNKYKVHYPVQTVASTS